ncbi:hypothetical protein CBM2626_A50239 [Cupriavidus taiwanensis]|nr:hypothetical protein CBM2626_A50239 [Cupriavidus taiwanensis]
MRVVVHGAGKLLAVAFAQAPRAALQQADGFGLGLADQRVVGQLVRRATGRRAERTLRARRRCRRPWLRRDGGAAGQQRAARRQPQQLMGPAAHHGKHRNHGEVPVRVGESEDSGTHGAAWGSVSFHSDLKLLPNRRDAGVFRCLIRA